MEKKQLEEERQKLEEEKVDKSILSYSNKNKELREPVKNVLADFAR